MGLESKRRLLDALALMSEYGFSRNMAYDIMSNEGLKSVKIGRKKFIFRDELEDWLKNQAESAGEGKQ